MHLGIRTIQAPAAFRALRTLSGDELGPHWVVTKAMCKAHSATPSDMNKGPGKLWTRISLYSGLVNVPIQHHPAIGDIIYNSYLKVMFRIPKKGHLPSFTNP